jgi:hypothetical protein
MGQCPPQEKHRHKKRRDTLDSEKLFPNPEVFLRVVFDPVRLYHEEHEGGTKSTKRSLLFFDRIIPHSLYPSISKALLTIRY